MKTSTSSLIGSRIESVALTRARQERRRQLGARTTVSVAAYVPRHRADVPVDSATWDGAA